MRALARAQHTQRNEHQERYTDRAKDELDGKHRGILAHMPPFSRRRDRTPVAGGGLGRGHQGFLLAIIALAGGLRQAAPDKR